MKRTTDIAENIAIDALERWNAGESDYSAFIHFGLGEDAAIDGLDINESDAAQDAYWNWIATHAPAIEKMARG